MNRLSQVLLILLMATLTTNWVVAHDDDDDDQSLQIIVELFAGVDPYDLELSYSRPLTLVDGVPRLRIWLYQAETVEDVPVLISEMDDDPRIDDADVHDSFGIPEGVQRTIDDIERTLEFDAFVNQPAAGMVSTHAAQSTNKGRGALVAVIDTGQSFRHPYTRDHFVGRGRNFAADHRDSTALAAPNQIDEDLDGQADDGVHHGAGVAGIIRLVAPEAKIIPIRAMTAEGEGEAFDLANAIIYAADLGADVINLSVAMSEQNDAVENAILYAYDQGIVIVTAAGNDGTEDLPFTARIPEVITVSSVEENLTKSPWSNYASEVDLAAPGSSILTPYENDGVAKRTGTSFAAPFVSGAAALVISRYPAASPRRVKQMLQDSAQFIDHPSPYDGKLGAGLLDLEALVEIELRDRSSVQLLDDITMDWTAVEDATHYDVIRGDVSALRFAYDEDEEDEQTIDLGSVFCVLDQTSESTLVDTAIPLPGQAVFLLFRDDAELSPEYNAPNQVPRLPLAGDCLFDPPTGP